MNWKGTKALVTGAGGFIGSHLAEELAKRGADVRAMVHYNARNDWGNLELLPDDVREKLEIISGDIRDPFFTKKAVEGCDVVFHLASLVAIPYSYIAPKDFVDTNVYGTLNVLQACLETRIKKIVHTSTSEVYGTAIYTPIDENHPLQGQSPYSATKIAADKIAESYHRSFDLPVAIIRPFNTFGPRQSARAIIPTIVTQILSTKDNKIQLGLLTPIRDFTYVKDTVEGFIKVAESKKSIGEIINTGTGNGVSIGELARLIMKLIGKEVKIERDRRRLRPPKSEVMTLICANKKAKKLLGWVPRYSLEEGLKETIDYIQGHIEEYKVDVYNI